MQPTQNLPDGYAPYFSIDLSKNFLWIIILNVVSLGLFLIFALFFFQITVLMRPEFRITTTISSNTLLMILAIFVTYALVIVLHELVHGLFFWLITRKRPVFGFRGAYAFAAAPDWFVPRSPYLIIGLSPMVLISLIGIVLIPILPQNWLIPYLFALTGNAAGSVGDLAVCAWLVTQPALTLVCDRGEAITAYKQLPGHEG
jgi:hypothetical protein